MGAAVYRGSGGPVSFVCVWSFLSLAGHACTAGARASKPTGWTRTGGSETRLPGAALVRPLGEAGSECDIGKVPEGLNGLTSYLAYEFSWKGVSTRCMYVMTNVDHLMLHTL